MTMTNREALLKLKESYVGVSHGWSEADFVTRQLEELVDSTLGMMSPEMLEEPVAVEIDSIMDRASDLEQAVEYYEMAEERLMESEIGWTPKSLIESIQEPA